MRRIPVLIIGGGPVGLALAAELGWQGIACELVEQGDGAIATPKMNEVNIRTMEFCRRWGIADQVLACPFPADYPMDVAFVTSLSGYELGRLARPCRRDQRPGPHSPMNLQVCSQTWFDPILRKFAGSFPHVSVRTRCRCEGIAPSGDGVIADLTDLATGERERVEAAYVAACDGAGSTLRERLGIALAGPGTLGHPAHVFFRAPDLLARCGRAPGTFFLAIDRDGLWANIRIIDPDNAVWRLMILDREDPSCTTLDPAPYLRRAFGRTVDVEVLGVNLWTRRSLVAERYAAARVFLAGDAAHQLSPTGALGMNTGIGDAVDLGWKLAAVLRGWGGERLLDSYDAERRPIGIRNVTMATEFHLQHRSVDADLMRIGDAGPDGAAFRERLGETLVRDIGRMFRTAGLQIGYRYERSPICIDDGTTAAPDDPETYTPSARPGARAPHVTLPDGRSILDLFGPGFALLNFGGLDATPLETAAKARRVPLQIFTLGEPEATHLYGRKLVLVRPDGHVAWRGDAAPDDPLALIDAVRGGVASAARG